MNTQAQAHGRGLRSHSILGLLGALGALGGPGGPKITAIGPNGKSKDINSEEELDAFLKESIEPESDNEFKVERDGEEHPVPHNHPLASILSKTSPFNGKPSSPVTNYFAQLAGLLATAPDGPNYQVPRSRGPRRLPWETRGCGNPECPIHGNRKVPSTPDDRGAVLTLSSAVEVEADYSEDPNAKDWIAWVRANYDVGYVRCGKCGAVTRVRYWNEFSLHDCTRKLPCLRCGAPNTQVVVDGAPDDE